MSDYNRPFNGVVPELVEDVSLKRARVETSDGGSAIRVTSTAADLAPITDALGTQQDPATTPTVIGLLKNLIASGGGGGGGSADYPLFKMQWNSINWRSSGSSETKDLATLLSNQEQTIPDWTKYIVFIEKDGNYKDQCAIFPYITESGEVTFTFTSVDSPSSGSLYVYTYTLGWTNYEDAELTHNQISLTPGHLDMYAVNSDTSVLELTRTATEPENRQTKTYYVLFFDTDPVSISGGGGGGGEAISTYSLTLNNTTVTNITAPTEDPPSSDDQTLVTVSYRRGLPAKLCNDLVNNQSTTVVKEGSVNLESGFSITLPEWTELITMGITNSGGYMDYVTMAADVNKSYVSVTGAGTIDVYSYNASTKDFTFVSGGDSIRILSIRVEGKTTI